jgi:hypothetical protein
VCVVGKPLCFQLAARAAEPPLDPNIWNVSYLQGQQSVPLTLAFEQCIQRAVPAGDASPQQFGPQPSASDPRFHHENPSAAPGQGPTSTPSPRPADGPRHTANGESVSHSRQQSSQREVRMGREQCEKCSRIRVFPLYSYVLTKVSAARYFPVNACDGCTECPSAMTRVPAGGQRVK